MTLPKPTERRAETVETASVPPGTASTPLKRGVNETTREQGLHGSEVSGWGLRALVARTAKWFGQAPGDGGRTAFGFFLIFCLLAAGILAAGYGHYRYYERRLLSTVRTELSAIAELKANRLAQYRQEWLGDGAIFFRNPVISALVRRFLEKPADAEAERQLQTWFEKYAAHNQYRCVCLLDTNGVTRLSAPAGEAPVASVIAQRVPEILRGGQVTLQDFHRNEHDQRVCLEVLTPIFDAAEGGRPLGVIVLRNDPAAYLFPSIQRWPVRSRTAEFLLVRREGNEVVFLNDLRYQTNAALALRIPLSKTNVCAVQAVLMPKRVRQGLDYRGVPVVAAMDTVSHSPWALVAKMDRAEVYQPIRERLWLEVLLVVLLLLGAGSSVGLVWRHQRARFYRKQAGLAEALQESEARFDFALRATDTGAWYLDLRDHTVHRTPTHDRIFGYATPLPRWTYELFLEHVLPEDRPAVEQSFRTNTAAQSDWSYECRIRRADGAVRWIWAKGAYEPDGEGNPVRMAGVVQDITERKQAEEGLRQSEAGLAEAQRLARIGSWEWDVETDEARWSDETYRLFGLVHGKLERHRESFLGLIVPDDRARVDQALSDAVSGTREYDLDYRIKLPDGTEKVIHARAEVVRNSEGKPTLMRGTVQDITDQKQAEAALRESEDRFRSLSEAALEGLMVHDQGVILDTNRTFARLFGYEQPAELIGKNGVQILLTPESQARVAQRLQRQEQGPFEVTGVRQNGATFAAETDSRAVKYRGRDARIVSCRDITERQRMEVALRRSENKLRAILDVTPFPIALVDAQGDDIVLWSKSALTLFGHTAPTRTEWYQMAYPDPDYQSEIGNRWKLCLERARLSGRTVKGGENRVTCRDGSVRLCELHAAFVGDEVVVTFNDITERTRAEAALRVSEEQFRSLYENAVVGFYRTTPDGRILLANPALLNMLGYASLKELAQRSLEDEGFEPSYSRVAFKERIEREGQITGWEAKWKRRDGCALLVRENCRAVRDSSGRTLCYDGSVEDITGRRQAEAALSESESMLQAVFESTTDKIWSVDAQSFGLLTFNRALSDHFFRERGLRIQAGQRPEQLFPTADYIQRWNGYYQRAVAAGTFTEEYVTLSRKLTLLLAFCPLKRNGVVFAVAVFGKDITERKRTEAALRESETRFRTLIEEAPIAIGVVRNALGVYANHKAAQLLGLPDPQAWVGLPILECFAPECREASKERSRRRALGLPVPAEFEAIALRTDGGQFPIQVTVAQVQLVDGLADLAFISDITERKQSEAALNRLAAIVESSDDCIIGENLDGTITSWNRGAEKIFGYTAGEMIGNSIRRLIPAGQPEEEEQILAKVKRGESLRRLETLRQAKDGRRIDVSITASPVKDRSGQIIGVSKVARDITQRKQAEAELRENEARYRTLVENIPQKIFLKSKDCRFVSVNENFARDLNARPEAVVGKQDYDFFPRGLADKYRADDQRVMATGQTEELEELHVGRDGQETWVHVVKTPVRDSKEDVIGVFGIFWDITERKRAELELKRTLAELERSNQELEQFAFIASHDLQEPLRMVASYTQLLAQRYENQLDERAQKYIHFAVDGALRMKALIDDLLAYSQVGGQGQPLETTSTPEALDEAKRNLATLIQDQQASITHDPLPAVRADAAQLVMMFQNLLSNALKFHGPDLPRIHVSAREQGGEWLFSVQDNGIGIEPQHAERVFELFQRLHTREEYPGTGIGLALCKRIVERHGGRIWFASEPGQGTTFFFTVPKHSPPTDDHSPQHRS